MTRLLQVCRWTITGLAVLLAIQLFMVVFFQQAPLEQLWCGDPLQYFDYFQTEALNDDILARRVVDTEGSAEIGDYTVRVTKVALDRTAEGTEVWFMLVLKPDFLWQGAPVLRGTVTCTIGEETASRRTSNFSYWRNLNHHYLVELARFDGDLLEAKEVTLSFTNGENSFTIPLKLEGGDIHEN